MKRAKRSVARRPYLAPAHMPVPPFGFTNPIYVVRHPVPQPPFPVSGGPAPQRSPP